MISTKVIIAVMSVSTLLPCTLCTDCLSKTGKVCCLGCAQVNCEGYCIRCASPEVSRKSTAGPPLDCPNGCRSADGAKVCRSCQPTYCTPVSCVKHEGDCPGHGRKNKKLCPVHEEHCPVHEEKNKRHCPEHEETKHCPEHEEKNKKHCPDHEEKNKKRCPENGHEERKHCSENRHEENNKKYCPENGGRGKHQEDSVVCAENGGEGGKRNGKTKHFDCVDKIEEEEESDSENDCPEDRVEEKEDRMEEEDRVEEKEDRTEEKEDRTEENEDMMGENDSEKEDGNAEKRKKKKRKPYKEES